MSHPERSPELSKRQRCGFKLQTLTPQDDFTVDDEIHGEISLPPVARAFIYSPQFQRLKDILQLGVTCHVFKEANHNRYEHSIGVAHLARSMCQNIAAAQPKLGCTPKDTLCVTLAGLLHDLGHGIFSHIYEQFVGQLKRELEQDGRLRMKYKQFPSPQPKWAHENASLEMIDAALKTLGLEIDPNNLDEPLKQTGDGIDANSMRVFDSGDGDSPILTSRDLVFVKECIFGGPIPEFEELTGRPQSSKRWLYDIVSNKHSGMDVDKMDYFARDSERTKCDVRDPPIDLHMIQNARVAKGESNHLMIVYSQSMEDQARKFFERRFILHDQAYQQKRSDAASLMMTDILCLADIHMPITLKDGTRLPMSRAMTNPEAYLKLSDRFVDGLKHVNTDSSSEPRLVAAKQLYKKFQSGELYTFAGEYVLDMKDTSDQELWEMNGKELIQELLEMNPRVKCFGNIRESNVVCGKFNIHHGKRDKDPVAGMRFVTEREFASLREHDAESLPAARPPLSQRSHESFQKKGLRFFSVDPKDALAVEDMFTKWIKLRKSGAMNANLGEEARCVTQDEEDEEEEEFGNESSHGFMVSQKEEEEEAEFSFDGNDWGLQPTLC